MDKIKIALDVDGTLAGTMKTWVDKYNSITVKTITIHDLTTWNFETVLGISKERKMTLLEDVWRNMHWVKPTELFIGDKVEKLKTLGRVDIVSSIPYTHTSVVRSWLLRWNILPYEYIFGAVYKDELSYTFYIDDNPELAQRITEHHKDKYIMLIDQPWNREIMTNANVFRCYGLDDAYNNISHIMWAMNKSQEEPKIDINEELNKIDKQIENDLEEE